MVVRRKTQTRSRQGAGSGAVLWRTCIYSNSVFCSRFSQVGVYGKAELLLSVSCTAGAALWEDVFVSPAHTWNKERLRELFLVLFRSVSLFDTRTVSLYLLPTWHWNKRFSLDKRTYHHALLVSGSTARDHFVWFVSCAEILKKLSCQEAALFYFFLHTVSKKHFTFLLTLCFLI